MSHRCKECNNSLNNCVCSRIERDHKRFPRSNPHRKIHRVSDGERNPSGFSRRKPGKTHDKISGISQSRMTPNARPSDWKEYRIRKVMSVQRMKEYRRSDNGLRKDPSDFLETKHTKKMLSKSPNGSHHASVSASSHAISTSSNDLWVAFQEIADRVLIFDPSIQTKASDYVYLFDVKENIMKRYPRSAIRSQLKALEYTDKRYKAIKQYRAWEKCHRKAFIRQELDIRLERK